MPRAAKKSETKSPYGVHPAVAMIRKWAEELPAKTGRSLEEWVRLVKASGPADEKRRRDWLKSEHGLGTNAATWIAERSAGRGWEDGDPEAYLAAASGYVDAMYAGPKSALRPLHDELMKLAMDLGPDVKACPCKTVVPLYRRHVFAQIKPTTRTRIDLGFALGDLKPTARLLETGGFAKGDRITHRIGISTLADIDAEVRGRLKAAYDMDE